MTSVFLKLKHEVNSENAFLLCKLSLTYGCLQFFFEIENDAKNKKDIFGFSIFIVVQN